MNREVRKTMKAAKEDCTEEQCKNTKKGMISGNSKEAYSTLRDLTETQQCKSAIIKTAVETS